MIYTLIYVTASNIDEAQRIATECVEAGFVACANILPSVQSVYKWEAKLVKAEEVAIFLKTTENKMTEVINLVKKTHSSKCPCVIALPIEAGNLDFLEWIQQSVV